MDFASFYPLLHAAFVENGLERFANEPHARRFHALCEHMLTVNQSMNLTAIREEKGVILRHFADSLTIEPYIPEGARIIDVGCGAGFPCLPLAICRPDLAITALDSTAKRITYVQDTAARLGCTNLTAIAARAEEQGKGPLRERFDVCTARAVAALPVLAELCLPLVRAGGIFLAMKATRGDEELESARTAIGQLGGKVEHVHRITLRSPFEEQESDTRIIIAVRKERPTPAEYPRAFARIQKKPL